MVLPEITRFAPSPTGLLHLGHAFAAIVAHDLARKSGGEFLLRLEDIDHTRCRPEFEQAIIDDLGWLGLAWHGPVRRQSERMAAYRDRLGTLENRGLVYPCFCTRQAIAGEIARMPAAPQGPGGPLYPGTCRVLDQDARAAALAAGSVPALRLDVAACVAALGGAILHFEETGKGPAGEQGSITVQPALLGDVILGRRDVGISYHLAVVNDDGDQGVTLVSRGEDLFAATHVQRLLQAVLGLPVPRYHHHRLITDGSGRRLAKRDRDLTLQALRTAGVTPAEIRGRLALPAT